MSRSDKSRRNISNYAEGIIQGDRIILGQAITIIESALPSDHTLSSELIQKILPNTGNSIRIGITGVPGVGKSTFIESFGKLITDQNKKVAVLTIDPSSQVTKGSILGDKTRMPELSKDPLAFIRPTASGQSLGGVSRKTREAMLLCEAAGFEIIIVETVGVGQSEVAVKNMVDFFLLLMLAGAGDELQGIKKGIMEMADALVITKADEDNIKQATVAQAEYQHALHLLPPTESGWQPKVLTASAREGTGIGDVWTTILSFMKKSQASGFLETQRRKQNVAWLHEYFNELLKADLQRSPQLREQVKMLEENVSAQRTSPYAAAQQLLEAYHGVIGGRKS